MSDDFWFFPIPLPDNKSIRWFEEEGNKESNYYQELRMMVLPEPWNWNEMNSRTCERLFRVSSSFVFSRWYSHFFSNSLPLDNLLLEKLDSVCPLDLFFESSRNCWFLYHEDLYYSGKLWSHCVNGLCGWEIYGFFKSMSRFNVCLLTIVWGLRRTRKKWNKWRDWQQLLFMLVTHFQYFRKQKHHPEDLIVIVNLLKHWWTAANSIFLQSIRI